MDIVICKQCYMPNTVSPCCLECGTPFVMEGEEKNIIDQLVPTCLVHRYDGSDMLESAAIVKEGKRYYHVATKLIEYAHPAKIPKNRVFQLNEGLLAQINQLRQERRDYINTIDAQMAQLWTGLQNLS